ncbi:MAG: TIGR03862 family flavoprotein [Burkholderiales bacterium]
MTALAGRSVAVIGAGPAGLMAAEALAGSGLRVDVYDAMPSPGRKFLMAGKGGLNLSHSEAQDAFLGRYGSRREHIAPLLQAFDTPALRHWVHGLGIETFIGSSGRVFPKEMKAAPLLRAWLHRLRASGVKFHMRHRWLGWNTAGALHFSTPKGPAVVDADAAVLATGGGSWARLGSDAAWVPLLQGRGVRVAPLKPANCGFDVGWSEHLRSRFAGQPLKSIAISTVDGTATTLRHEGEFVITETGIEGGVVYALSSVLRDAIEKTGRASLHMDLLPGLPLPRVIQEVSHPRGSKSLSSHLQSRVGIKGVKAALLRELAPADAFGDPVRLSTFIKALPVTLRASRPVDEAISTAGGVVFEELDENLMLRAIPGLFCAGEMLDWEAPTGGYLLAACLACGRAAGQGALAWLTAKA